MKKLIFIDDSQAALDLQTNEMNTILAEDSNEDVEIIPIQCDMCGVSDCLDEHGVLVHMDDPVYNTINHTISNILEIINNIMQDENTDMAEAVIDLSLDDNDETLGVRLVRFILNNLHNREWFNLNRLIITLTSSYRSAGFSNLKERFLLPDERKKVLECYRPIKDLGNNKIEFNKTLTAFPRFHASFHLDQEGAPSIINRLLLDKENVPGNTGTQYGNYFGMIYARLYKTEGAI